MLKKIYNILRIVAYACTLGGVGLLIYARNADMDPGRIVNLAGFVLIVIGFTSFLCSYGVFLYSKFTR